MKNKKAIKFLGEHTVNLVIAAIVIVLLIIFGFKLYGIWSENSKTEKIKKQMENLVFSIKEVNEKGNEEVILIFPIPGWYLKSFPDYDFPLGECRGAIGCLCICEDINCNRLRKCEGFDFDVQLMSILTRVSIRYAGPKDPYTPKFSVDYPGTLEFKEEIAELRIVKENIIKLYEMKK